MFRPPVVVAPMPFPSVSFPPASVLRVLPAPALTLRLCLHPTPAPVPALFRARVPARCRVPVAVQHPLKTSLQTRRPEPRQMEPRQPERSQLPIRRAATRSGAAREALARAGHSHPPPGEPMAPPSRVWASKRPCLTGFPTVQCMTVVREAAGMPDRAACHGWQRRCWSPRARAETGSRCLLRQEMRPFYAGRWKTCEEITASSALLLQEAPIRQKSCRSRSSVGMPANAPRVGAMTADPSSD